MPRESSFHHYLRQVVLILCLMCCQSQNIWASSGELYSEDVIDIESSVSTTKKTNFLINASQFIHWPETNIHHLLSKHFELCILDMSDSGEELAYLDGKVIGQQELLIKRITDMENMEACRLVYIRGNRRPFMDAVLKKLADRGILSVGDSKLFVQAGGMMGLVYENKKVTCYVNRRISERVGFRFSARLLEAVVLVD